MEHLSPPAPSHCPMFFTVSLRQPGADLLILEVERLRHAVRVTRMERPFQIDAWVVLPDHLHAIWTLPDADHAARWRLIKARFAKGRPIWQPRFWARPLTSAADYDRHMRACQLDPVRHGLVDEPGAWPFSSFQTKDSLVLAG